VTRPRIILLTLLAMLAFAGNSLLCRLALRGHHIGPAEFTLVRIAAGALMLWLILIARKTKPSGNWPSALALFAYAIAFSLAYSSLTAATGALLLFASVQVTMVGYGLLRGEKLAGLRLVGFALAASGLLALLLPGVSSPPLLGSALMICAGAAWGVYSLRGRGVADAIAVTGGNFVLAVVPATVAGAVALPHLSYDAAGVSLAVVSGAIASGVGYSIWYTALRGLKSVEAATVQLSVPVIAAAGGVLLLGETLSWRLAICALVILGGIGLTLGKALSSGPLARL
jgi:drug/metabolite transporter (DMT)-like permease